MNGTSNLSQTWVSCVAPVVYRLTPILLNKYPINSSCDTSHDFVFPGSNLAGGGNLFNHKRGSIAYSLSFALNHRFDMTEILCKRT